jgi:hypothetical protein
MSCLPGATSPSAIAYNAGAATVETRINTDLGLAALGGATASVTRTEDGHNYIYTITFSRDPGVMLAAPPVTVALQGPADNGILQDNVTFQIDLINNALELTERDLLTPVGDGDTLAENAVGSVTVTVTAYSTDHQHLHDRPGR